MSNELGVSTQALLGHTHLSRPSAEEAFLAAVRAAQPTSSWCALLHEALTCRDVSAVVAGVVLSYSADDPQDDHNRSSDSGRQFLCVSLGSGTRCVGLAPAASARAAAGDDGATSPLLVRDGHAEVMARRGFVAFLLDAAEQLAHDSAPHAVAHPFVEMQRFSRELAGTADHHDTSLPPVAGWTLRAGVQAHLVCTHWPCGGLGLAATGSTGAKIILETPSHRLTLPPARLSWGAVTAPSSSVSVGGHVLAAHRSEVDREGSGVSTFASRVKPGKGHGNLNMSCTDKVWRWNALGLQGRRRLPVFPQPIVLTSLHVVQLDEPCHASAPSDTAYTVHACQSVFAFRDDVRGTGAVCQQHASVTCGRPSAFPMSVTRIGTGDDPRTGVETTAADSRYSRSAWIQLWPLSLAGNDHPSVPGKKRPRTDEPLLTHATPLVADPATEWTATWHTADAVVINTKAGLPQGASLRLTQSAVQVARRLTLAFSDGIPTDESGQEPTPFALARAAIQRARSLTSKYPLSRAWFGERVLRLLVRGNAAQRTLAGDSLCGESLSRLLCDSRREMRRDPVGWFLTRWLPFLDKFLRAETECLTVGLSGDHGAPDVHDRSNAETFVTGGSPPHWLYCTALSADLAAASGKPEARLLWVEK